MEQRTHFLRDVANSSAIRKHLIENWNKANLPSVSHNVVFSQQYLLRIASSHAVPPLILMQSWPNRCMVCMAICGECLAGAAVSQADRQRLLHVVIVGGGPTGVEFAGELSNFISAVSTQPFLDLSSAPG